MKIKEKIIRQSIKKGEKRLKFLKNIQNATPAIDIIDIKKELFELLDKNKGIEKRTSKQFNDKLNELHVREKKAWKMVGRQKKFLKDSKEMAEITVELQELKTELYFIKQRKHN